MSSRQSIDTLSVTHCPPKGRGLSRHRSFSGGGRSRGSEALLPPRTPFPWQPEARRSQSRDRGKGLYHPETRRGGPGAAEDPALSETGDLGHPCCLLRLPGGWWRVWNGLFVFRLNLERGCLDACMALSFTINTMPCRSANPL